MSFEGEFNRIVGGSSTGWHVNIQLDEQFDDATLKALLGREAKSTNDVLEAVCRYMEDLLSLERD